MVEENQEQEKKNESVVETEEMKDVEYKKDYVTFVIKPLRLIQVERWAKWCNDRGLSNRKEQPKAFALAMDILEGKTQDIINSGKHIQDIETLLQIFDKRLTDLETALNSTVNEPELDANEKARLEVRKRKEAREKVKEPVKDGETK